MQVTKTQNKMAAKYYGFTVKSLWSGDTLAPDQKCPYIGGVPSSEVGLD